MGYSKLDKDDLLNDPIIIYLMESLELLVEKAIQKGIYITSSGVKIIYDEKTQKQIDDINGKIQEYMEWRLNNLHGKEDNCDYKRDNNFDEM